MACGLTLAIGCSTDAGSDMAPATGAPTAGEAAGTRAPGAGARSAATTESAQAADPAPGIWPNPDGPPTDPDAQPGGATSEDTEDTDTRDTSDPDVGSAESLPGVGDCGQTTDWQPMSIEGVVTPLAQNAPEIHGRVIDGKFVLVHFLGSRLQIPLPGATEERGVQIYDPATDRWRHVPSAEQPPRLALRPELHALADGRYLVNGTGSDNATHWATFDPMLGEWQRLEPGNAPSSFEVLARQSLYGVRGSVADGLLVSDGMGGYAPLLQAHQAVPPARQHLLAYTAGRLFKWGGASGACGPEAECLPSGYVNDDPDLFYVNLTLFGGGEVLDPVANAGVPVATVGAPSPRFYAQLYPLGTRVLVFGGVDIPRTGPGAGPYTDHALTDGAIYDFESNTWTPFVPPNGLKVRQLGESAPWRDPEFAHMRVQWTGRHAVVTFETIATGTIEYQSYLYDLETNGFRPLPVGSAGEFLVTKAGTLLLLDYRFRWLTVLDVDDLSTRRIELNPPASWIGSAQVPPTIHAWDGCKLFVWGAARVTYEGDDGCGGDLPPNQGCDPVPPRAVLAELLGGAMLTIDK